MEKLKGIAISTGLVLALLAGCNLPQADGLPAGGAAEGADTQTRPVPSDTPTPYPSSSPTPAPPTIDDFFSKCPTAEQVADVNADLSLRFETDPTAGTLACTAADGSADLTTLQKRVYLSILAMQELHFDQPLPWTDRPLYQWFVDSIDGIRIRQDIGYSSCCDPANFINIQLGDNSYLALTDRWIDPSLGGGLMDTMILFVHEARHNNGYPHTCSNGQDDRMMEEMGSWAVQAYLQEWIAQHIDPAYMAAPGNNPLIYRQIALQDSVVTRNSRFCGESTLAPEQVPTLVP